VKRTVLSIILTLNNNINIYIKLIKYLINWR
jgi:hypothetical protein